MSKFYTSIIPYGNSFRIREVENGIRTNRVVKGFVPELYIPSGREEPNNPTGLDGEQLRKLEVNSVRDAKDKIDQYKDVAGFAIYGTSNFTTQFISKNYEGELLFDPKMIRVFNIDIEVYTGDSEGFPHPEQAAQPINLIQLIDSFDRDTVIVWGCGDYNAPDDVDYRKCRDEEDLLRKFVEFWEMNCPDVFTGWNVKGFDVPYIMNRVDKVLGDGSCNRFSPWNNVRETKFRSDFGNDQLTFIIDGVAVLDYIDLYKKYTYSGQESYKLDNIAYVELGERKVDYSDIGSLHGLCDQDYQKFVDYGVTDTRLVQRIDDKMKLLDLVYTLAYLTKQNYTDTFSPVKTWESLIYLKLLNNNKRSEIKRNSNKVARRIAGAYVKAPEIGKMRRWVMSLDLNSLYPHLIAQYNIGFDTLVPPEDRPNIDYVPANSEGESFQYNDMKKLIAREVDLSELKDLNMTMTPNGAFYYTHKQSIVSELMMGIYTQRKSVKREMLDLEEENERLKEELRKRETA